jgi:hypothetical protein
MPDQSSAANEHAILQEITGPLATLPDDPVPIAADVDFPVVLRGYDRLAVDDYVYKTSQLVAELQAARSPEAAVRRALERVGEQISGILQRAHDTAAEITTQSRREAEDRLEQVRREAAEITANAEVRLKELDAETDRIWVERHRIVDDVRELSRQLVDLAETAATRFPPAEETDTSQGLDPDGSGAALHRRWSEDEAPLAPGEKEPRLAGHEGAPTAAFPGVWDEEALAEESPEVEDTPSDREESATRSEDAAARAEDMTSGGEESAARPGDVTSGAEDTASSPEDAETDEHPIP